MSPPGTTQPFRIAALLATMSAWSLIAVGGVVRITESGLGCPDWPLCEGKVVPAGAGSDAALEFTHRAVAAAVIVLCVLVAVWAWARFRARRDLVLPATVAVALIPGQALLGAVVVWLELPAWMVGLHFVIGLLFLAATTLTAVFAWPPARRAVSAGFLALSRLTLAVAVVLVSLGAAVVAMDADNACGAQWPQCNGAFVAGGTDASVQVAHRTVAYVLALLVVGLVVLAWRGRGPRLAPTGALVAVVAQMGFGIGLVVAEAARAHEALAVLHVAGSGAVFALLVALTAQVERLRPLQSSPERARLGTPVAAS